MAEAAKLPEDPSLHTDPVSDPSGSITIPKEVEYLITSAIQRSFDDAFRAVGTKIPPPKEQELVQRVTREVNVAFRQTISASYQGPLPPPPMLAEFERIIPGLSTRIVKMAEMEQSHRHRWELRALWNDMFMESGALSLGWLLAGACVIFAFFLGLEGKTAEMGILLGVTALQMVRTIVSGNGTKKVDSTTPPVKRNLPKKKR